MGTRVHDREHKLAQDALALMDRHKIPPTPDNYELFFLYASGENSEVQRGIDQLTAAGGTVTPQALHALRQRCLDSERAARAIEELGNNIGLTIDQVMGKLAAAGKHANDYGKALSAASGELGSGRSPAAVQKLVDGLIGATQAMESRTRNLEGELQRSSERINELKTQLDQVRKESETDALTGIANRKTFDTELANAIGDAETIGEAISLLMCDIDHFKTFNDTWGHQTGDQVLRLVANSLSDNVKGRDTAARYGGEEFAVILRHTAVDDAIALANQIRASIEAKKLVKKSTGEILGTITISIGVTEFVRGDTSESLIHRSDMCLYRAKQTGRNRVVGQSGRDVAPSDAA
jgi:diguanylate cyclase